MIHIDIYVPALDESFEFRCDEEAPAASVIKDIYDVLSYKIRTRETGSGDAIPDEKGTSQTEGTFIKRVPEPEGMASPESSEMIPVGQEELADFWLCDVRGEKVLSGEKSLKEQGIYHGNRLIFL